MVKEENYVTLIFKKNGISTYEKPNNMEIIYEEVMTEVKRWDERPVKTETKDKAPLCTHLTLVVAGLVIMCVILVSVILTLFFHSMREQTREIAFLTAQNLQLSIEKTASERQTEELTRERDQLNWTIRVIMEYDNFPVNTHCPQKVCKPCLDNWVLFQSNCYLFTKFTYWKEWENWENSRKHCRSYQADLVVIESQEEQKFISNHTENYHKDDTHGYWFGLSKENPRGTWTWVDRRNLTVMYWKTQQTGQASCALILPKAPHLANWWKAGCDMKNRWICEKRALIKPN